MPTSDVCDTNYNSNQGCGVTFRQASSYGSSFNDAGGGYYVVARTRAEGVRVWFWSRYDPTVPPEVRDPTRGGFPFGAPEAISPNGAWGVPDAFFPTWDNCGYDGHFNAHALVFDLTFCVSPHVVLSLVRRLTLLCDGVGRLRGLAVSFLWVPGRLCRL